MIVSTPGTLGGKPRIDGRRISVQDIVVWRHQIGMTIEEIVAEFDLSPTDILDALSYYETHRAEIDRSLVEARACEVEMRERYPSRLAARLKQGTAE